MGIFKTLRNLRAAKDFDDALPQLEQERDGSQAEVDRLEAQREDVIFSGNEAEIAKLGADIAAARERVSTLDVAIEGAKRRRADAAAREHTAEVEAKMAEAPGLRDGVIEKYKRAHVLASQLVDMVDDIRDDKVRLQELNQFAIAEGRNDLKVDLPLRDWMETVRQARVREWAQKSGRIIHPSTPVDSLPDIPVNLKPGQAVQMEMIDAQSFRLPGYPTKQASHGAPRDVHWLAHIFSDLSGQPSKPGQPIGSKQQQQPTTQQPASNDARASA